jgi:hypothetical protein
LPAEARLEDFCGLGDEQLRDSEREPRVVMVDRELAPLSDVSATVKVSVCGERQVVEGFGFLPVAQGVEDLFRRPRQRLGSGAAARKRRRVVAIAVRPVGLAKVVDRGP